MAAGERLTLYRTAIQTGLRSNELRSLTRGNLYLDPAQPYVTCKAGSTKNHKDARQYIQPELADELQKLIATKAPKAPVFDLPHESNMARMMRGDLSAARKAWLAEVKGNPEERIRREQSDFLTATNHEGELVDFHCLRHTCGAWLAMTGAHPKVVQTVMRHSTITLTMDTYGHLFPGQEVEAVGRMRDMLSNEAPEAMRATGTDNAQVVDGIIARSAWRSSQGATLCVAEASQCNNDSPATGGRISESPEKIGTRSNSMPSVTMPCNPPAPLAQLAEQLTLNQ